MTFCLHIFFFCIFYDQKESCKKKFIVINTSKSTLQNRLALMNSFHWRGHAVGFCWDARRLCIGVKMMLSKVMCPCILGDGKIVLEDEHNMGLNNGLSSKENGVPSKRQRTTAHPVDLELEVVLGKMPRKVFGVFSLWKILNDLSELLYISKKLTQSLLQE